MILDTDIHNFYEHLVLKEIEKQGLQQKLNSDQMADLCCLTLNQLPAHYIRHNVDMIYFLTDAKRTEMEKKVIASLRQAYDKIQAVPTRQA
ncbi:late competence development ComFB family protein [Aeromonas sp. CPF2-S1]|nr:late competence development ComFB family protein [Aeromonas sp. CPF2-S1]